MPHLKSNYRVSGLEVREGMDGMARIDLTRDNGATNLGTMPTGLSFFVSENASREVKIGDQYVLTLERAPDSR
jgi:hypothetical protein